jgi:UDP-glucose 4-epimerase
VKVVVTGCAGFIGSHMVDRLLADGHFVVGIDNFSTGIHRFLADAQGHPRFRLVEGDLLSADRLPQWFEGGDLVMHLAANADVRFGTTHARKDLEQNTIATHNVLEAMRVTGISRIAFSSTGSVYGEAAVIPTPEDAPFPVQTSLYGASKLAAEGLIAAYCEGFGFTSWIFRFVSILGERYTHGHVIDFCRQLRRDPTRLRVLGDGTPRKSYLYVHDCTNAVLLAIERAPDRVNIFNLGVDGYCTVRDSIGWISEALGVRPELEFGGGDRGWTGDNPFIFLATSRIRSLGWEPRLSIREGVVRTVRFLEQNPWLFEARP